MKATNIKETSVGATFFKDGRQYFKGGNTAQGYVFKDEDAYKAKNGVCYISEYKLQELPFVIDEDGEEWAYIDNRNIATEDMYSTYNSIYNEVLDAVNGENECNEDFRKEYDNLNAAGRRMFVQHIADFVFDIVDWQGTSAFIDADLDIAEEFDYWREKDE